MNKNTHYLIEFEDFELLPGVAQALRIIQELDFRLFVVSNQSGVARGFFPLEAVEALHLKIQTHLGTLGIRLEDLVFCPHHPQGKVERFTLVCACRKPEPGMLLYLASKYELDLAECIMVGDNEFDALTGINAGAQGVWLRPESVGPQAGGRVDNRPNLKEFVSLLDFAENLRKLD